METNPADNEKKLFQPGGPGGPGRPKGSKSVKSLLRAAEVLTEGGRHPVAELIKLADECVGKRKEDRVFKRDIWLAILPYVEAPQTEPTPLIPQTPEESVEFAQQVMASLTLLSKPLEPPTDPHPAV